MKIEWDLKKGLGHVSLSALRNFTWWIMELLFLLPSTLCASLFLTPLMRCIMCWVACANALEHEQQTAHVKSVKDCTLLALTCNWLSALICCTSGSISKWNTALRRIRTSWHTCNAVCVILKCKSIVTLRTGQPKI